MANWIPKIEYDTGGGAITITFAGPPKGFDPKSQVTSLKGKVSKSSSGLTQTSIDYLQEIVEIEFEWVSNTLKELMDTFMLDWALTGGSFKYFYHEDEVDYITVELEKRTWKPKGDLPEPCTNSHYYDFKISMRRVVG